MILRALSLMILLSSAVFVQTAQAHSLSVAHVEIDSAGPAGSARIEPVRVELALALRDIALSLPLDADRDEQVTWGELQQARPSLEAMVVAGLSLSSSSGRCSLVPRTLAIRRYDSGAYAVLGMDAGCPDRSGIGLRYGLLFDRDPQHRAIVTLRDGTATRTAVVTGDQRGVAPTLSNGRQFAGFVSEGVLHILSGYDHLAFLLSLLLPAALVRLRGEWQPLQSPRQGIVQIIGIVTAFTAAHSITLSLSALGWVVPASGWIEPVIAASVLLAALNNIWPWVTARVWTITFAFGLIHGFGFAGALSELGLPQTGRLLSLLGFNLGVELGQLAVVCAALPLLFLLRGKRWYSRRVMPLLSLTIAATATVWLWQRLMTT
jgi:HupE / UreJ protein